MKFLQMMNNMIFASVFLISCFLSLSSTSVEMGAPTSPYEILQGVWEMEGEVESYMIFENHINYSIVVMDGNIIVRKRFFGFFDSLSGDSLDIRDFKKEGIHFVIFTGKYQSRKFVYDRYASFNEYEYDLDEDYFIYYGNDPIILNKVDALPKRIQKVFDVKKVELSDIKFLKDE